METYFILTLLVLLGNNRSAVFEATTYLPVLCHKLATTCQIDSSMVANLKLKPELCNCANTKIIESTAPPQQQYNRDTILWDTLLMLWLFLHELRLL